MYVCMYVGCPHGTDSVSHYFRCCVLRGIAQEALGCAAPSSVSILSALGVRPVRLPQIHGVYILFTVYHKLKSQISTHSAPLAFSRPARLHSCAVAQAAATKLQGMIPGAALATAFLNPKHGRSPLQTAVSRELGALCLANSDIYIYVSIYIYICIYIYMCV